MKPEVFKALIDWLAGIIIGFIPLTAHGIALLSLEAAPHAPVVEGWSIDVAFLAISTSGASILSAANRLAAGKASLLKGRAAPCLLALNAVFIMTAAIIYGGVVSGHSQGRALFFLIGTSIGAAAVSLYLELTLAALVALSNPPPRRRRKPTKMPQG